MLTAGHQQNAPIHAVVGAASERNGTGPAAVPGGIAAYFRESYTWRCRAGGRISGCVFVRLAYVATGAIDNGHRG